MDSHQVRQKEVIHRLEEQIGNDTLSFTTVAPVADYENDTRICLTSVHFPHEVLQKKVQETLITPLRMISPEHFYYPDDSLHMTIKNVRVINDPQHFNETDITRARDVFAKIVP